MSTARCRSSAPPPPSTRPATAAFRQPAPPPGAPPPPELRCPPFLGDAAAAGAAIVARHWPSVPCRGWGAGPLRRYHGRVSLLRAGIACKALVHLSREGLGRWAASHQRGQPLQRGRSPPWLNAVRARRPRQPHRARVAEATRRLSAGGGGAAGAGGGDAGSGGPRAGAGHRDAACRRTPSPWPLAAFRTRLHCALAASLRPSDFPSYSLTA